MYKPKCSKSREDYILTNVMISVVSPSDILEVLALEDFEKVEDVDLHRVYMEITSGYYSYLRGDKNASGSIPSIFYPNTPGIIKESIQRRGNICVFLSREPESGRSALHFVGPEDALPEAMLHILKATDLLCLGSVLDDIKLAIEWMICLGPVRDMRKS